MTYTNGPWAWDTDPNGDRWIIGDKSTWVPRIAKIPRYSEMPNEANARLIAAAPELVEALRGFVESARYDPTMDGRGAFKGWAQSDLKRAEVTARALLARIDG
jgi:hypothetical protein